THFLPELIEAARRGAGAAELAALAAASRHWGDLGLDRARYARRLAGCERRPDRVVRALYELYAERHGKPRWGDKTPAYVRRMRVIAGALPEARFVHLVRDGRDVLLS